MLGKYILVKKSTLGIAAAATLLGIGALYFYKSNQKKINKAAKKLAKEAVEAVEKGGEKVKQTVKEATEK